MSAEWKIRCAIFGGPVFCLLALLCLSLPYNALGVAVITGIALHTITRPP